VAQGEGPEFKPQYHKKKESKKKEASQALVAHTCNPSYSGGSGFETSLGAIVCETLSQKNPSQKELVEWLKV
jgi:hypothetical protein